MFLQNDFRKLLSTSGRFKAEYESSREEIQSLRTEMMDLKSANVEMKNELANKVDVITTFQMENVVLQQRCEVSTSMIVLRLLLSLCDALDIEFYIREVEGCFDES